MKKYLLIGLLLLTAVRAEAKLMDLGYFELDNGLKVAVVENHKAPIALAMVYYKVGSVNDPNGQGGIAHLLEHMMFRGTKNLPKQMFNELADENGAANNAYTTYGETAYHELADISKLELMLAMEAERMQNLTMDENDFLKERGVVLQERMQRFETNPVPLFYEMMSKSLWQNHPLAKPVSGSVADINGLTVKNARDFYDKYYCPDNALLVLAGDITINEARILAQKYFGAISPKKEKYELNWDKVRDTDTEMVVKLEGINQPRYVQYIRIDEKSLTKKDVVALDLLTAYFTEDDSDYLIDKLVYQDKSMLGVSMGISYDDTLGGTLALYAIPSSDKMTLSEIKKILWNGITDGYMQFSEANLEKIKHRILANTVYMQESMQSSARFVSNLLMNGYSAEEIRTMDDTIRNITLQDIQTAWQKVMTSKGQVSGYLTGRN